MDAGSRLFCSTVSKLLRHLLYFLRSEMPVDKVIHISFSWVNSYYKSITYTSLRTRTFHLIHAITAGESNTDGKLM